MMTVLVLVMLRRKKVGDGDVEEEGDCEGPRVDVDNEENTFFQRLYTSMFCFNTDS